MAAFDAAVMMAVSGMAIGVSATTPTLRTTSKQTSGTTWKCTTSITTANTTVTVAANGYYYKTKTTYGYKENGNGSNNSGVTCYLTNSVGHGWGTVTSIHKAVGYGSTTLNSSGSYVK